MSPDQSALIVDAFETFVCKPLEANLVKLTGHDLTKRNPMIYTARGTTTTDEWIDSVIADRETSAIEAHLGTWQEEVARIVSGGTKPASGIDLQIEGDDGVVRLYAIQASARTQRTLGGGRQTSTP